MHRSVLWAIGGASAFVFCACGGNVGSRASSSKPTGENSAAGGGGDSAVGGGGDSAVAGLDAFSAAGAQTFDESAFAVGAAPWGSIAPVVQSEGGAELLESLEVTESPIDLPAVDARLDCGSEETVTESACALEYTCTVGGGFASCKSAGEGIADCVCGIEFEEHYVRLLGANAATSCSALVGYCVGVLELPFEEEECFPVLDDIDETGCHDTQECLRLAQIEEGVYAVDRSIEEATCAKTEDKWFCNCSSDALDTTAVFRFDGEEASGAVCEAARGACSNDAVTGKPGLLSCTEQQGYPSNENSCWVDSLCSREQDVGGVAMEIDYSLSVDCSQFEDPPWNCNCRFGLERESFELDSAQVGIDVCRGDALARCAELFSFEL